MQGACDCNGRDDLMDVLLMDDDDDDETRRAERRAPRQNIFVKRGASAAAPRAQGNLGRAADGQPPKKEI